MIHIKYILKLTDRKKKEPGIVRLQLNESCKKREKYRSRKHVDYLGSAQNEVLSNSGTIKVTFKYLAIATISHICLRKMKIKFFKFQK